MDWIHCNECYTQPGQHPKRQFNLTSCGHIFCQCCEKTGTIEACRVCKNKCTTTQLTSQMDPEIQSYFEDPEEAIQKAIKVMEFQREHRLRMQEARSRVVQKYKIAKIHIFKLQEELNMLKRELEVYKQKDSHQRPDSIPNKAKSGPPLLPRNSQASKAIRMNASRGGNCSQLSQQFKTPSSSYGGNNYRGANHQTPYTPLSDVTISPVSITSSVISQKNFSTPHSVRASVTPPIHNLKLLSLSSQNSQSNTRF